ncbi:S41 family peptidase [Mucilaginibacter myungsuensis]
MQGSTIDLIKDSIYLYTKETYYWNNQIPAYDAVQPRNFSGTTEAAALSNEVNALALYAINPANNLAYEYVANSPGRAKYSFIDNGQTSEQLGGSRADFGFAVTSVSATDMRVRYVYEGSAAGNANLHRGEQITAINGRSDLNLGLTADYNFVVNALGTTPINMTLRRGDNTTYSVTLNSSSYTVNPVITYKMFDQGNGKKVGYMVLNSFTSPANAQSRLETAMNYFATNNVTDLVVDLRYNGGGYVSTAETLTNMIAPAAKNNTTMYATYYNSILTNGQAQLLKNQYFKYSDGKYYNYAQIDYSLAGNTVKFAKRGNLNVNRVFFIVTGSTASASELTINNLRPHMDVKLIGRNTYGKPVGFFAMNINKYQLYVSQFETKNSQGQGGYYTGMLPGSTEYPGVNDADDLTKDFGDPTEKLLQHALNFVATGTYGATLKVQSTGTQTAIQQSVGAEGFNGMVMDKAPKLKK